VSSFVSVCMICRNEENTISRCLRQIAHLVDEIIVVDTGSTDRTVELATRFTSNVFQISWKDDFSAARNYSLAQARGEWLLILDADEVLYESELVAALALAHTLKGGGIVLDRYEFEVDYERVALGDDISWPEVETRVEPKLRLVRNAASMQFVGSIHESLDSSRFTGPSIRPNIKFAHYRDKHTKPMKHEYYMRLEEQALVTEPHNSNAHYNALEAYVMRGWQADFNRAIRLLRYIEPRFVPRFKSLRRRLDKVGWHVEASLVADLIVSGVGAR
jgi:glycosyltransferase involved in cell wall biosynthesis